MKGGSKCHLWKPDYAFRKRSASADTVQEFTCSAANTPVCAPNAPVKPSKPRTTVLKSRLAPWWYRNNPKWRVLSNSGVASRRVAHPGSSVPRTNHRCGCPFLDEAFCVKGTPGAIRTPPPKGNHPDPAHSAKAAFVPHLGTQSQPNAILRRPPPHQR